MFRFNALNDVNHAIMRYHDFSKLKQTYMLPNMYLVSSSYE